MGKYNQSEESIGRSSHGSTNSRLGETAPTTALVMFVTFFFYVKKNFNLYMLKSL